MTEIQQLMEKGERLSVRKFENAISSLSAVEQQYYYYRAYHACLFDWLTLPGWHRVFLFNLVERNPQPFLDYLIKHTILGTLRYTPDDPELFRKVIYLMAKKQKNNKKSLKLLAFVLLVSFNYNLKISTLCQYLRTEKLFTDELLDLLATAQLNKG